MKKNDNFKSSKIKLDVLNILSNAQSIGWKGVSEYNIHRIAYFASVFNAFINETDNEFENNYSFILTLRGPYSNDLHAAIISMLSDELIINSGSETVAELVINNSEYEKKVAEIEIQEHYLKNKNWFKSLVYILALYGEDKLYDFIFRDPEYRSELASNRNSTLNITKKSKTVETLNEFRDAFEQTLQNTKGITKEKYLELYFEYVFSKVLSGEIKI